jgi:NADPH:quinone reductase-like Zn-dependent oxidoreductase
MPTPTVMKAVTARHYGGPEVLAIEEVPVPQPGAGEVLVRVAAAGLDRGAWHLMTGLPYLVRPVSGMRRPRRPVVGGECSGVVEAVGHAVTRVRPGDVVMGGCTGAFAEYALAKEGAVTTAPGPIPLEHAAALPISGVTALQALRDHAEVGEGTQVLVIGASGGVGTLAVQLARGLGAEVTGVCSAAKADLVRSLGATRVIDYATQDISDGGARYDVIVDTAGNRPLSVLRPALTASGSLVIVGGEDGGRLFFGLSRPMGARVLGVFTGQRMGTFVATTRSADLDVLRRRVEEGTLRPVIDRVASFADLPDAMRDLEAGRVRGKVVAVPS